MSFGPPPSVYTESALASDKKRRSHRRRLAAVAGGTALALVCVGGWFLWDGASGQAKGHGSPAAARAAADDIRETVERPPVSPEGVLVTERDEEGLTKASQDRPRYAPGTWVTDKIVAKGVANRIEGYRFDWKDKPAWRLDLDGHICAVSRHVTVDGRTAVAVQPHKRKNGTPNDKGVCDEVVFFELNTGKKLWQKTMPAAEFAYATNTNLTLTKGVVAVAWGHGSVAYDMKSGGQLWNSTTTSKCEDRGFAGGRALLALLSCGAAPNRTFQVQRLDPRTGKERWTYRIADGVSTAYLPSSDPPVIAVAAGDTMVTDLISLDDKGRHMATISLDGYEADCDTRSYVDPLFGVVEVCDGVVVGRDHVFVTSKENTSIDQPRNWIVAFDLKTGHSAGKFEGRPFRGVHPLRMSGDDLLIFRQSAGVGTDFAAVVAWNPQTDKETPLLFLLLPEDDGAKLGDPLQSDIVVEHGRVVFSRRELVLDDEKSKDPVLMLLAYGTEGLKH
ncbi:MULTISPECIES: PQQ-binding-like beta-propeller repeat protein [unclassified Streptomyces]|uniref:outer membrane protein assembly factor BamB family protein n=1 Tax=unclassified Streptomyces TaxID=2593676 RepID=UPI003D7604B3